LLWNIIRLPSICTTALILLTSKVSSMLINWLWNAMHVLFPLSLPSNNNLSCWRVFSLFVMCSFLCTCVFWCLV
jgi:hypothetical protein